jgi:hypothetical protein
MSLVNAEITGPIKLMVAVLLGIAVSILVIAQLAGINIFPAATSTALISTNSNLTNGLPIMGMMVAIGLVFVAMDRRSRR